MTEDQQADLDRTAEKIAVMVAYTKIEDRGLLLASIGRRLSNKCQGFTGNLFKTIGEDYKKGLRR